MSAFAFLQRVHDGNTTLTQCGHSPQAIKCHFVKECRFVGFMALTLVAVLLLQNAVAKHLDIAVRYIFPNDPIKGSLLELLWAVLIAPVIIILGLF